MVYQLSLLATFVVLLLSVALGIGSAFVFRDGPPRVLWALLVSLVFVVAGIAAVLLGFSWLASDNARFLAQAVALGAMLTGLTYSVRDKA